MVTSVSKHRFPVLVVCVSSTYIRSAFLVYRQVNYVPTSAKSIYIRVRGTLCFVVISCFFSFFVVAVLAEAAQRLVDANHMSSIIKVVKGKVEEIELPEKVDVIVSEPIGFLLVRTIDFSFFRLYYFRCCLWTCFCFATTRSTW